MSMSITNQTNMRVEKYKPHQSLAHKRYEYHGWFTSFSDILIDKQYKITFLVLKITEVKKTAILFP